MTRVLVVGGNGTIGKLVIAAVKQHIPGAVILVGGRDGPDVKLNINDGDSVKTAFAELLETGGGPVDHLVSATGDALFKAVSAATREDLTPVFSKAISQIDLVLQGAKIVKDGGSITLTSGVLAETAIPYGAFVTAVNAAVNGFVRTGAYEMPRGIRLNVVSPGLLEESAHAYGAFFPGEVAVPGRVVALAYMRAILSHIRGKVLTIRGSPAIDEH